MSEVARELRRLHRKVAQAEQRLAMSELRGAVSEVDADKRRCRVEIARTADDKPVLSPWIQWAEPSNGLLAVHTPMQVGDLVTVRSPSGVLGTASIATRDGYSGERPAPSKAEDATVEKIGDLVITRRDGALSIKAKDTEVVISGDGLAVTGGKITHDEHDIGKDHRHTDVMGGDATSGPPQ